MCVAIAQKQGADTLTETQLENGWDSNPHGGGYSYINPQDGKIVTQRFMDKDDFIASYRMDHQLHREQSPFIVHMRIATHGGVKIETVHPFTVCREEGEMSFIHNGIINNVDVWTDKDTSDTMVFRDLFLDGLPQGFLDNRAIYDLIEEYVGYSKLVFLTTEPEAEHDLYIIGEGQGYWIGDTWFSNKSCETKPWSGSGATPRYGRGTPVYGSYEYYSDSTDLDEWLARGAEEAKADDKPAPKSEPSMSLVVRDRMNQLIIQSTWPKLVEEAVNQGYCELCLFSPCMCSDTCYYCNHRLTSCMCDCWVSIEDMGTWVGFKELQEIRREDLQDEYKKEGKSSW